MQFCQPTEEVTITDTVYLQFSTDTLTFDTVFTGQISITRRLKVFNPSEKAVTISSIRLGGMASSSFSLIVNGIQSNQVSDLYVRGSDSLLILATVTLNSNSQTVPFLVSDSILFVTNSVEQKVHLTSYGQNTTYYSGDTLSGNTTWDSTIAKYIKKTIFVPQGSVLTIEKGTKIYFSKNAGLKIAGTLVVKGDSGNKVIFQGSRLDQPFREIPGLWKGIEFTATSTNNSIDFAEIKNAETGIMIGDTANVLSVDLKLTNTIIKNMTVYGLKAYNTELTTWNCLVYNCAYNGFLLSEKGTYKCYNNTFAFVSGDFTRFGAAVEIKDGDRTFELINNIIWGNDYDEIVFSKQATDIFRKNLVRSTNDTLTSDTTNIWNKNPLFISTDDDHLDFQLDSLSPARDKAQKLIIFSNDLKGKERGEKWDIGAFEHFDK